MEIAPNIHSLPVNKGAFMGTYSPNVYLVAGREAALIDAGYGDEADVRARVDYIKGLADTHLAYIVVTHAHADHAGGAEGIKEATGAKIVLHRLDAETQNRYFRATTVDMVVEDGDTLAVDGNEIEVIHSPGHSPGHICLYLRRASVLFSGDNVPGAGTTAIAPPQGDMGEYVDSLRRLLAYDIEMIYPGHGPAIKEPRRKIQELIDHRLDREEQVLSCLRRGKGTIEEMVREIYPELDRRLLGAARGQVLAHLIKLEREKRVTQFAGETTHYTLS